MNDKGQYGNKGQQQISKYDIIGDIHGHADDVTRLLDSLGYQRHARGYRHPGRQVVFVGDFVDRRLRKLSRSPVRWLTLGMLWR